MLCILLKREDPPHLECFENFPCKSLELLTKKTKFSRVQNWRWVSCQETKEKKERGNIRWRSCAILATVRPSLTAGALGSYSPTVQDLLEISLLRSSSENPSDKTLSIENPPQDTFWEPSAKPFLRTFCKAFLRTEGGHRHPPPLNIHVWSSSCRTGSPTTGSSGFWAEPLWEPPLVRALLRVAHALSYDLLAAHPISMRKHPHLKWGFRLRRQHYRPNINFYISNSENDF